MKACCLSQSCSDSLQKMGGLAGRQAESRKRSVAVACSSSSHRPRLGARSPLLWMFSCHLQHMTAACCAVRRPDPAAGRGCGHIAAVHTLGHHFRGDMRPGGGGGGCHGGRCCHLYSPSDPLTAVTLAVRQGPGHIQFLSVQHHGVSRQLLDLFPSC